MSIETAANTTSASQAGSVEQRTLTGTVVSSKTAKTIAVEIERLLKHPQYGKYVRRTTRLLAHDEAGEAREGDTVTIAQCRPISRRKSWKLVSVVERGVKV
jgi:small subunit ribosomal protein S17